MRYLVPMETQSTLVIFTLIAALGLVGALAIDIMMNIESAAAWHSQFASKKECTTFMINTFGNTTSQAQAVCNKVIPH